MVSVEKRLTGLGFLAGLPSLFMQVFLSSSTVSQRLLHILRRQILKALSQPRSVFY